MLHVSERRFHVSEKGLIYGGKETVLDAMILLNDIWSADKKYVKENMILRCWRKTGILPASWNADINNAVGSASHSAKDNTVYTEDCNLMCSLITALTTNAATVDVNTEAYGLQDSFVEDSIDDPLDFRAMVEVWIEIEGNEHIIEAEFKEAIEVLEAINVRVDDKAEEEEQDNDPMDVSTKNEGKKYKEDKKDK